MTVGVIGLGAVGGAALRFLAAAGHRAVGLERFAVGHGLGSSHGHSRLIRAGYPDDLYCGLMKKAFGLWEDLERECGRELLTRCGGLYFGTSVNGWLNGTAAALARNGFAHERLTARETRARFPQIRMAENEAAIWEPGAGFLQADACVRANVDVAVKLGADIRENVRITAIESVADKAIARDADGNEWEFDALVMAAGAWTANLHPELRLPLTVTRQQVVYAAVSCDAQADFAPSRFPVWVDADRFLYGFPDDGAHAGIKLAAHAHGEAVRPDAVNRTVDAAYAREMGAYAAGRLVGMTGETVGGNVCLYTSTPDEDFVIDRLPHFRNGWFASACSGHGFKLSVLTGRILADLSTTGRSNSWNARFSMNRLA